MSQFGKGMFVREQDRRIENNEGLVVSNHSVFALEQELRANSVKSSDSQELFFSFV